MPATSKAPVVRFAPSPTGKLHVGNARTALMNQLFILRRGGRFVLRIDDTDVERSTKENEAAIEADLAWLGFRVDAKFNQSDRFDRYGAAAARLREAGLLYACYETEEELERKRRIQRSRGEPPVYDRAALTLTGKARQALEAEGRKPHWRFKLSGERLDWTDLVRGPSHIETSSVSDPILVREDGSYLYTLPSVLDDVEMGITHIVRGEDHVTNSAAQIEIFRALGAEPPLMAHTPLLVGPDGEKLSKRLGSLALFELRAEGIEPLALCSLLAALGTSDAIEAKTSLGALAEAFDFAKVGRAPARFDPADLKRLNAQLLHVTPFEAVGARLAHLGVGGGAAFWEAVRPNLETLADAVIWWRVVEGPITPEIEDEGFAAQAAAHLPQPPLDETSWRSFAQAVQAKTGAKGKALYQPLRRALTGHAHGPEMDKLFPLIGADKARARLLGRPA